MSFGMKQCIFFGLITALGFWGFGLVWADEGPLPGPRTLVVALDETGDYVSLQQAVDAAQKGAYSTAMNGGRSTAANPIAV